MANADAGYGPPSNTGGTANISPSRKIPIITSFPTTGDRIIFTNASLAGFSFSLNGSTLNYSGGSMILSGGITGSLVAGTAAEGGVQISIQASTVADVANDFNGDGRSDVLWRDGAGTVSEWLGQANGSFAWNPASLYQVPASWVIEESGDYNGDGRDDILWRDGAGTLSEWLGQANGSFAWNSGVFISFMSYVRGTM